MKSKKSGKSFLILIIILFFIGAAVLAYPAVSNMLAKYHQLGVIDTYNQVINNTDSEVLEAEKNEAIKYNESLILNNVVLTDPFDPNAPKFPDGDYLKLLNLTDAMANIEIPALKIYLPIYHGTSEETLAKGVGHLEGTSLPVGGLGTHAALSAHCGLPTAELFTNLEKLQIGNIFYIHVLGDTLVYQIDQINTVDPFDSSLLKIDSKQDYVTLITCTPYGVNTHRLLVRGVRIYPEEASDGSETLPIDEPAIHTYTTIEIVQIAAFALAGIFFIIIVVLLISILLDRKRKKSEK